MIDPLKQFAVKKIVPLDIAGIDISFTNASLFMVLATVFILLFHGLAVHKAKIVPSRLQSAVELLYEFIAQMLKENAGQQGLKYFPFVFSLFLFVLVGNLLGLVPYGFTFTSHIIVTFALAFTVFILVTFIGLYNHGWKFFRLFFPEGTPLVVAPILIPVEIIAYFARPVTLAVRLFANMLAGHVILKVFAGFTIMLGAVGGVFGVAGGAAPIIMNVVFTAFEIFVAFIQAYVFTILTCLYLHDAIHLH